MYRKKHGEHVFAATYAKFAEYSIHPWSGSGFGIFFIYELCQVAADSTFDFTKTFFSVLCAV